MSKVATILILSFMALWGCDSSDFRETKVFAGGVKVKPSELNLGRRLYMEHCFACHGKDGEGNGPAAKGLNPPPRNFKQGLFKFGHVLSGGLPRDEDLCRIVHKGLHGTAMLPWDLEMPAIMAIVHYIKTFAPDVWEGEDKKLGEVMSLTKDPYGLAHRQSAIERGRQVYHMEANCQACHRAYISKKEFQEMNFKVNGEKMPLEDIEEDFHKIKMQESEYLHAGGGERAVKTLPPEFTWHRLRSGESVGDIFLRLKSGVGGTTMPAWHEVLSDQDIWALSYYVKFLVDLRENPKERKSFMTSLREENK